MNHSLQGLGSDRVGGVLSSFSNKAAPHGWSRPVHDKNIPPKQTYVLIKIVCSDPAIFTVKNRTVAEMLFDMPHLKWPNDFHATVHVSLDQRQVQEVLQAKRSWKAGEVNN